VAIADVFDALTMSRPYKQAWPVERAIETIRRDAGAHFDPQMVDHFVEIVPEIMRLKGDWDKQEGVGLDQKMFEIPEPEHVEIEVSRREER
jgi:putative two-component system response regulator